MSITVGTPKDDANSPWTIPERRKRRSKLELAVRCWSAIKSEMNGFLGLVLFFPYRSAKIEPLPATPFMAGSGGGWIALGLVVRDRFRVWSAAVFA